MALIEYMPPVALRIDPDGTLSANSDATIASQKATKSYADTKVNKTDARKAWARALDGIVFGTLTRDANDALTAATFTWPDGTPGAYASLVLSSTFLGAVDSYQVTYGSPVTNTYTQPTVTRNANGAVTVRPDITVS